MIGAAVAGGALLAGGTVALVRANKQKSKARGVHYGGSPDQTDNYRMGFMGDEQEGRNVRNVGLTNMEKYGQAGTNLAYEGGVQRRVALGRGPNIDRRGSELLEAYDPQAQVRMQSQATTDEAARMNLAAAGAGDALSMRTAVNANAEAGVQAAQNAAIASEAAQAGKIGAQAGQFSAENQQALMQNAQNLQEAQMGANLETQGLGLSARAADNTTQAGLGLESEATQNLLHVEDQQTALALDYEKRRQAEGQRRSNNLWNLGTGMIGSGGKILGGMGGGG